MSYHAFAVILVQLGSHDSQTVDKDLRWNLQSIRVISKVTGEITLTYIAIFLKFRHKPKGWRVLGVLVDSALYVSRQQGQGHFTRPVVQCERVASQDLQLVDQMVRQVVA